MASDTLFISDVATLKKVLRISAISDADSLKLIELAIKKARTELYQYLGTSSITTILTYSSTDTPSTDDEIIRSVAEYLEIILTKRELLKHLKSTSFENSSASEQWNDSPFVRELSYSDITEELQMLENEIEYSVEQITEGEKPSTKSISSSVIGPSSAEDLFGIVS